MWLLMTILDGEAAQTFFNVCFLFQFKLNHRGTKSKGLGILLV